MDEIKLFQELGHTVFSLHGAYQNGQGDGKRPSLNMDIDLHLFDVAIQCSRENIAPELIAWADIVYVMHRGDWIESNLEKLKGKKVVLRTIGQNTENNEKDIHRFRKDIKIVRMSQTEESIPGYEGKNALIPFYKDEDEFQGYTGQVERVVNVSQAMFGNEKVHSRGDHMNIDTFKAVVQGFPWKVYGSDNEYAKDNYGGLLSYEDLKNMLRFNRVFLYTGTQPSPYSLALIEAMMTGIPVVSIGPKLGTSVYTNQKTWEMGQIIENGKNGFVSDSVAELRAEIEKLLKDKDYAIKIGQGGRTRAIQLFGRAVIKPMWEKFFQELV